MLIKNPIQEELGSNNLDINLELEGNDHFYRCVIALRDL